MALEPKGTFNKWAAVPEYYKAKTSLEKMGLLINAGQFPVAIIKIRGKEYNLYDIRDCAVNQKYHPDTAKAADVLLKLAKHEESIKIELSAKQAMRPRETATSAQLREYLRQIEGDVTWLRSEKRASKSVVSGLIDMLREEQRACQRALRTLRAIEISQTVPYSAKSVGEALLAVNLTARLMRDEKNYGRCALYDLKDATLEALLNDGWAKVEGWHAQRQIGDPPWAAFLLIRCGEHTFHQPVRSPSAVAVLRQVLYLGLIPRIPARTNETEWKIDDAEIFLERYIEKVGAGRELIIPSPDDAMTPRLRDWMTFVTTMDDGLVIEALRGLQEPVGEFVTLEQRIKKARLVLDRLNAAISVGWIERDHARVVELQRAIVEAEEKIQASDPNCLNEPPAYSLDLSG